MKHLRLDGTSPGPRFVEGPGDIPGVMVPGDPENKKLTLWLIGFPGVTKYSGWVAEVCYQDLGKDYGNTVYTLNLADAAKLEVRTWTVGTTSSRRWPEQTRFLRLPSSAPSRRWGTKMTPTAWPSLAAAS